MKHYQIVFGLLLSLSTAASAQSLRDTISINDVVVTGTRNATDVRHLPMTVTVVDRPTLTQQQQPSILSTLSQQVPGLFVSSRGVMGYGVSGGAAGYINMRGIPSNGGQMLVLIDGHPQYSSIYGHPIADNYQTLRAERVEVLHGPASMLYGSNAMGGVINIVTRGFDASRDTSATHIVLGAGSYGTVQTEASYQERYHRRTIQVGGQYNRSDNHRPRMGFDQLGGFFKFGYDFSQHWNTTFNADFAHFSASYPDSIQNPIYSADQDIARGTLSLSLDNHYDRTSGGLSVYTNLGQHRIDDGTHNLAQPTTRYFRSRDMLTGVSWYQSVQLFDGNRVTVGFDYQNLYGRAFYTDKATGAEITTGQVANMKQAGRSHRDELAGYVDFRQDILSWLTLDAGVRYDYMSVTGDEWIPQAGLVVRPTSTSSLKAMASKGFRHPTMREMYLYPPANEELEPERLWNYELSWRQHLGDFSYGLNLFYIKGDNMIQTVNRQNVNTGEIENYGAELIASYRLNPHLVFNTNHSLLHMKNAVAYAPKYKGLVGANYQCGRFGATANLQYINGLYTRVTPVETTDNFFLLNASLSYRLCPAFQLWARGENLLAQDYEIMYGFPMPHATFMGGVTIDF